MKNILFTLVLLFAGTTFAKRTTNNSKKIKSLTQANNQTKFDIRKPIKEAFNKYKKGIRAGVATGSLEINTRQRFNSQTDGAISNSSSDTANTNFQLHVGYEEIEFKELGFSSFLTYQDINEKDGNVRNMRISGNATYGLTKQAYTFAGLNFSKYYGPGILEEGLDAGIGYQAGVGLNLHKKITLEIEYLTLLNEGSRDGYNNDISAKGMMIKLNTPLFF